MLVGRLVLMQVVQVQMELLVLIIDVVVRVGVAAVVSVLLLLMMMLVTESDRGSGGQRRWIYDSRPCRAHTGQVMRMRMWMHLVVMEVRPYCCRRGCCCRDDRSGSRTR